MISAYQAEVPDRRPPAPWLSPAFGLSEGAGATILATFTDNSVSGRAVLDAAGIRDILVWADAHPGEADSPLVTAVDRLGRDPRRVHPLIAVLQERAVAVRARWTDGWSRCFWGSSATEAQSMASRFGFPGTLTRPAPDKDEGDRARRGRHSEQPRGRASTKFTFPRSNVVHSISRSP